MSGNLIQIINKQIGETPLEALENFRVLHPEYRDVPITYAGRLDPMASGKLLILIGKECSDKEKYLNLDKVYEIEVLFGISTDTYDILGIPVLKNLRKIEASAIDCKKYEGKLIQEYPPYSSKTHNGVQLHALARQNKLPPIMPSKEVEIYSLEVLSEFIVDASELEKKYVSKIKLVNGDFRQEKIISEWHNMLHGIENEFSVIRFRVSCSSGTYMRSLAERMGRDLGTGAFALNIERTEIWL